MTDTFTYHHFPFKALGSVCELKLYLPKSCDTQKLSTLAAAFVQRYQDKYTRYSSTSLTSQINAGAGSPHFTELDTETNELFNYANTLFEQSNGLFDITSGVLRRAWNFSSEKLPEQQEIDTLLPLIGWSKVERKGQSIRLPLSGMEIDFGGYVKEYIADKLAQHLEQQGVVHGLVNLGGDIKVIGPHPNDEPWIVGIQHPREKNRAIAKVKLHKGGIASSGDYERYMLIDGIRYCHLLNPKTGKSLHPHYASVSVVADECLIAGSFTSAALLCSSENPEWLSNIGLPYLCVDQNLQLAGTLI